MINSVDNKWAGIGDARYTHFNVSINGTAIRQITTVVAHCSSVVKTLTRRYGRFKVLYLYNIQQCR